MNEQANGGHECVFVEEQEPNGRLILGPCLTCDTSAMDALEQLRDDTCGPVETDDHSVNDPRCDYAPATNSGAAMSILTELTTGERAAMRAETFREAAQIVRDCAVQGLGLEAALRALLREAEPR